MDIHEENECADLYRLEQTEKIDHLGLAKKVLEKHSYTLDKIYKENPKCFCLSNQLFPCMIEAIRKFKEARTRNETRGQESQMVYVDEFKELNAELWENVLNGNNPLENELFETSLEYAKSPENEKKEDYLLDDFLFELEYQEFANERQKSRLKICKETREGNKKTTLASPNVASMQKTIESLKKSLDSNEEMDLRDVLLFKAPQHLVHPKLVLVGKTVPNTSKKLQNKKKKNEKPTHETPESFCFGDFQLVPLKHSRTLVVSVKEKPIRAGVNHFKGLEENSLEEEEEKTQVHPQENQKKKENGNKLEENQEKTKKQEQKKDILESGTIFETKSTRKKRKQQEKKLKNSKKSSNMGQNEKIDMGEKMEEKEITKETAECIDIAKKYSEILKETEEKSITECQKDDDSCKKDSSENTKTKKKRKRKRKQKKKDTDSLAKEEEHINSSVNLKLPEDFLHDNSSSEASGPDEESFQSEGITKLDILNILKEEMPELSSIPSFRRAIAENFMKEKLDKLDALVVPMHKRIKKMPKCSGAHGKQVYIQTEKKICFERRVFDANEFMITGKITSTK